MSDKDWKDVNANIVKGYKAGASMATLARRFNVTLAIINRAISEQMIKESP